MTAASDTAELTLGPNIEFMRNLWRLNRALELFSRRLATTFGVTAQQRMIIRCVGKYPGMTATQLARHFHLDAGTVSTALARLERKGLLERRRAPRDRRRLTLGLTLQGRAIDRTASTPERAVERLLHAASSDDIASSQRVLEAFTLLLDREAHAEAGAVARRQATGNLGRPRKSRS